MKIYRVELRKNPVNSRKKPIKMSDANLDNTIWCNKFFSDEHTSEIFGPFRTTAWFNHESYQKFHELICDSGIYNFCWDKWLDVSRKTPYSYAGCLKIKHIIDWFEPAFRLLHFNGFVLSVYEYPDDFGIAIHEESCQVVFNIKHAKYLHSIPLTKFM